MASPQVEDSATARLLTGAVSVKIHPMITRATFLFLMCSVAVLPAAEPTAVVFKSAAELAAGLQKAPAANADLITSELANSSHYRSNLVKRDHAGAAVAHGSGAAKGSEIHYIVDGSATLVTGGTIVKGKIEGGETRQVGKGDAVFIAAGVPHWYSVVNGSVTYLEVRFDVEPEK